MHDDRVMSVAKALRFVAEEVERAEGAFPPFNSAHEGAAVIREEFDELWGAVRANDAASARAEAVQVAAMAVRFLRDVPADGRRRNE